MDYDVIILGNSIAANLFARHLTISEPKLKTLIIGPKETPKYSVGESMTELASHYFMHRLKLTGYFYRNQLFKNGLRFFYDNKAKSLDITEMSEEGAGRTPFLNTFHIDRWVIDNDLKMMNRERGVDYECGMVKDVALSPNKRPVVFLEGKEERKFKGNWVIDASGIKQFISKKLKLPKDIENNYHCTAWGHFKAQNNIDEISDEWRRKNLFTTREFSTIHFLCPHYWIWVIPLKDDVISCGLVYDSRYLYKSGTPDKDEFIAFLEKHNGLNSLFRKDNLVNFKSLSRYSYLSKEYISIKSRFALLGDAGSFIDPLYSPALDVVAQESDIYTEIILDDFNKRKSKKSLAESSDKANAIIGNAYKYYAYLGLGKFKCIGSLEIFGLKYLFEFYTYLLWKVWSYISRYKISDLYSNSNVFPQIVGFVAENFLFLADLSKKRNIYYRKNKGWRQWSANGAFFDQMLLQGMNDRLSRERYAIFNEILQFVLLQQLELYLQRKDLLCDDSLVSEYSIPKILSYSINGKRNNKRYFMEMEKLVRSREKHGSKTEFWSNWLKKVYRPHVAQFSGERFYKLKKGMPFMDLPAIDFPEYPDEEVSRISSIFRGAQKNVSQYVQELRKLNDRDNLKPFLVEAIAAGMVKNGTPITQVVNHLLPLLDPEYVGLVYMGCGVGAYGMDPEMFFDLNEKSEMYLDWFINGYGFSSGLAKYFKRNDLYFPSRPYRKPLVRGLGRCVTFIPNEENSEEKYEKFFNFFELYPQDREDFYAGVGFSLAFTKRPAELRKLVRRYNKIFHGNKCVHIKRGIREAVKYKSAVLSGPKSS